MWPLVFMQVLDIVVASLLLVVEISSSHCNAIPSSPVLVLTAIHRCRAALLVYGQHLGNWAAAPTQVLDTVVVDCWDAEKAGSLAGGAPGLGGPLPDGPTAPGCLRDDPEADACMAVLRAAAQWCKGLRHLALSFCDSDPMDGWGAPRSTATF